MGALINMAINYLGMEDYDNAIINYKKALQISMDIADHSTELLLLLNIGFI